MRSALSLWRAGITLVLAVSAACGQITIDYTDFIQHGDIQYVAPFSAGLGRELTDADLGPEQFRVKDTLARGGHGGGGPAGISSTSMGRSRRSPCSARRTGARSSAGSPIRRVFTTW